MNPNHLSDLDWLAFRYVADELGEAERSAFEEQLAADQPAREAVARAVELTHCISAARELDEIVVRAADVPAVSRATSHRTVWTSPLAWMSIGAAACLVLVAAVSFGTSIRSRKAEVATNDRHDLELAHAWSTAREELSKENESWWEGRLAPMHDAAGETPLARHGEYGSPDDIAGVPSWMQSAVASGLSPDATNERREN